MRHLSLFIFATLLINTFAQEKYFTKSGHINFYSHAPLEDITADNDQVAAFLNVSTGEISFAVLMKSFHFEKALMQEHFNENYIESDKFPKASFKGTLADFQGLNIKEDGEFPVLTKGKLTIHGVTNDIEAKGQLMVKEGKLSAISKFIIKPEDYDIKIPKAVRENIAKEIEVNVKVLLDPFKK